MSNLYKTNLNDEKLRPGFHAGVLVNIPLGEVIGIQPEALFSTKGNKATYDIGPFQGDVKFNLNYVDVPILAVVHLGDFVELQGGPYFGYLISSSNSTSGDLGNGTDQLDKSNFKQVDKGLALGLGLNFGSAQIGARYNIGMTKIAKSESVRQLLGNAKNSVAQVYLALFFGKQTD